MSNAGTIGRLAVALESPLTPRTTFQKSVAVIKPNYEIVTGHYLELYFEQHVRALRDLARGTSQKNLLLGDLCSFPVALPSLDEQHRLSESIDKVRTHQSQTRYHRNKLRSLKIALMQDLLTGTVRVTSLLTELQEASE